MTYVANPADGTRPLDTDDASGGAAELRALKAYLQTLIVGGTNPTGYSWQGGRNRMRNGAVRFDQHSVGVGVVGSAPTQTYGPDGYKIVYSQTSKLAIGRVATGVIVGGIGPVGCPYYTVAATNTAVAAPGAADFFALEMPIEDNCLFDFQYGLSTARQLCMTFWARASIAGDYAIAFRLPVGPRSYPTKFNIAAANTWQFITIQVPGDLANIMTTTGATGMRIWIDFGSGSNFNAVNPNQWNANDLFKQTGCVEMIKTLNATFHISKVQVEPDNVTPFEFLNIQQDAAWNQRYYWRNGAAAGNTLGYLGMVFSTTQANVGGRHPVQMRAAPTMTASQVGLFSSAGVAQNATVFTPFTSSVDHFSANVTIGAAVLTAGHATHLTSSSGSAGFIEASAEF